MFRPDAQNEVSRYGMLAIHLTKAAHPLMGQAALPLVPPSMFGAVRAAP